MYTFYSLSNRLAPSIPMVIRIICPPKSILLFSHNKGGVARVRCPIFQSPLQLDVGVWLNSCQWKEGSSDVSSLPLTNSWPWLLGFCPSGGRKGNKRDCLSLWLAVENRDAHLFVTATWDRNKYTLSLVMVESHMAASLGL